MIQLNIAEAKAHFSEIIKRAMLGEEVIIAKGHHPIVKIVPLAKKQKKRRPGSGAGQLTYMADDFDAVLEDLEEYM